MIRDSGSANHIFPQKGNERNYKEATLIDFVELTRITLAREII